MNTTENNVLIAEFVGFKVNHKIGGVEFGFRDDYSEVILPHYPSRTIGTSFCVDELQFHVSWDWLMPVVEKIETIDRRDEKGKFLLQFNSDSVNWNNTPPTITGINKKHATYKAVVEFIKWYNENKED